MKIVKAKALQYGNVEIEAREWRHSIGALVLQQQTGVDINFKKCQPERSEAKLRLTGSD